MASRESASCLNWFPDSNRSLEVFRRPLRCHQNARHLPLGLDKKINRLQIQQHASVILLGTVGLGKTQLASAHAVYSRLHIQTITQIWEYLENQKLLG